MFHRVLAKNDPRWHLSDPEWTVSTDFFEECLIFFKKHFNVISLKDYDNFLFNSVPLPRCPLIITFDDGWSDNENYALKILTKHSLNAIIFVVSDIIDKKYTFWQETLLSAWQCNAFSHEKAKLIWQILSLPANEFPHDWTSINSIRKYIGKLNSLDSKYIENIKPLIYELANSLPFSNLMLTQDELLHLYNSGMIIGSHGMTHIPLTKVDNPEYELNHSREMIKEFLSLSDGPNCFSFPHSQLNDNIVLLASKCGYKYLFCGYECLNKISVIKSKYTVFGRFNIHQGMLSNKSGHLKPELMAIYMFIRPHKLLTT